MGAKHGCFYVKVRKSSSYRAGHQVQLLFQISQHLRDKQLIDILVKFFGSGRIEKDPRRPLVNLRLEKFYIDIDSKIIPFFFDKYLLQGSKLLDYRDFCKVASLMKNNSHLTSSLSNGAGPLSLS